MRQIDPTVKHTSADACHNREDKLPVCLEVPSRSAKDRCPNKNERTKTEMRNPCRSEDAALYVHSNMTGKKENTKFTKKRERTKERQK